LFSEPSGAKLKRTTSTIVVLPAGIIGSGVARG
jgi:hypothetical protein